MSTATELAQLTRDELEATASKIGVKNPSKDDATLIRQIESTTIENTLKMSKEAEAAIKQQARKNLGSSDNKKNRPSPQDIVIKFSKKVIAEFKNLEHPADEEGDGADIEFISGSSFFHLYDGHRFVMPLAMVTDQPLQEKPLIKKLTQFWISTGMDPEAARHQAIQDLLTVSMPKRCATPVFKTVENAATGEVRQVIDRYQPRFLFIIHGDAPEGARVGELMDPEAVSVDDEIAEAMKVE